MVIELFDIGSEQHPKFNMPILKWRVPSQYFSAKPKVSETPVGPVALYWGMVLKDVLFKFLAQHNCWKGKCLPTGSHSEKQEHQDTEQLVQLIDHADDDHFVINIHGLHNAVLLHNILPCKLTEPRWIVEDCVQHHYNIATLLQVTQTAKCAKTAEKSRAMWLAKKAAKAAQLEKMPVALGSSRENASQTNGCKFQQTGGDE